MIGTKAKTRGTVGTPTSWWHRIRAFGVEGLSEGAFGSILLIPVTLLLGVWFLFPIGYSFYLSLHEVLLGRSVKFGRPFVGLDNYLRIFSDPVFPQIVRTTVYMVVGMVSITTLLALAISLALNERFKGRAIARTLLLVPWAVPGVVNAVMWKWVFNYQYGIANTLLVKLGVLEQSIQWLNQGQITLRLVILASVWKATPFMTLLLLAALQNVPDNLYRAARVDGASTWQQFKHITLPLIKYKVAIVLILQTMWSIKAFDLIKVMTGGGPGRATTTINFYAYDQGFEFLNVGYGSALSYILAFVILVITLVYYRLLMREY